MLGIATMRPSAIIRAPLGSIAARRRVNGRNMTHEAPETIEVEDRTVACDGGGGALGHPRVFLKIAPQGFVECPYCDRKFVLKAGAKAAGGH
jgi:uncharacterized Zn-finger protein